jgi:hypothetical protein
MVYRNYRVSGESSQECEIGFISCVFDSGTLAILLQASIHQED